jgi:hypothetical protein
VDSETELFQKLNLEMNFYHYLFIGMYFHSLSFDKETPKTTAFFLTATAFMIHIFLPFAISKYVLHADFLPTFKNKFGALIIVIPIGLIMYLILPKAKMIDLARESETWSLQKRRKCVFISLICLILPVVLMLIVCWKR